MILKRTHLIILASIAISSSAFGQVQEAATNFEVPTFEAKSLDVHGEHLFSYDSDGALSINLGSDFLMTNQSPERSWKVVNALNIDMNQADKDANMSQDISDDIWASYSQFFGGSRGISARATLHVDIDMNKGSEDEAESTKSLNAHIGIGAAYGRILDARTVAQAAAMCAASKKTCSAADLAKIADIIGKNSAGYYAAAFKADAAVQFNADLSAATGGDAFKNAQILSSPIYNIGSRFAGYEAGALLNVSTGDHLSDDGDPDAGQSMYAHIFAGYAMLLDDNSGVNAGVTVDYGIGEEKYPSGQAGNPGDGNMRVRVDVGYSIDHNTSWNTNANVYYNMFIPKEGDGTNNWGLHAETNYAMGTQATVGAAFNLCGGEGDGDPTDGCASSVNDDGDPDLQWNVMARFQYFVF